MQQQKLGPSAESMLRLGHAEGHYHAVEIGSGTQRYA